MTGFETGEHDSVMELKKGWTMSPHAVSKGSKAHSVGGKGICEDPARGQI